MIYHVVPLDDWLADPGLPYAPPSLPDDGYVRCCTLECQALAVAEERFARTVGPLMTLLIDEHRLDARVRWEPAPHIYGRVSRTAVTGMLEIRRDGTGRALAHALWS